MTNSEVLDIDMTSCRICLTHKKNLFPLFDYAEVPTYGEMLTSCANVKVFFGDGFPDKICCHCSKTLKSAYNIKITAEKSDVILKSNAKLLNLGTANGNYATKKISFNSITDIKSELDALNIKPELEVEIEIELLDKPIVSSYPNAEALNGKDIVICNTVIRKIEPHDPDDDLDLKTGNIMEAEFLDDDFLQDDPGDEDYYPPEEIKKPEKTKFKKPKLDDIRVFKENKIKKNKENKIKPIKERQTTFITCYPLLQNGEKGAPVLLRRPKDASMSRGSYRPRRPRDTDLGAHKPVYVSKSSDLSGRKPRKIVCIERPIVKQREKHVCPVCGVLTFGLANHMLTHAEKKPFQCDHCTRSFSQKNNYKVHMKKHEGVKDHVCEICGAAFYCQKSVMRHMLIHKGERPFGCDLCSKRFIARCDLTRHQKIHSGYKPFKCTMCTMSFNAKHQLQNHERMHTGERPYSCKVCNVAFSYKVNLNNHVFRVHGINLKFKSIHTITEEVLARESEAMSQARIQANALLTMALQHQPQPVPEDQITTQIVYEEEAE